MNMIRPYGRRLSFMSLLSFLLTACAGALVAQETFPIESKSTTPSSTPRGIPPLIAAPSETATKARETFRPFDHFNNVILLLYKDFSRFEDPDLIVIPSKQLPEFIRRELAKERKTQSDGGVVSLHLTGAISEQGAKLEAVMGVRVDSVKGATIPIEMAEAHLTDAQEVGAKGEPIVGAPLPVIRRQAGSPCQLVIDRPGVFSFRLKFFVDVDRTPTETRLSLTLPVAPVKSATLHSAESLAFVREVKGGTSLELSGDRREVQPPLRADDSLALAWRSATDRRSVVTALTVSGTLTYRLGDSNLETEALLQVDARPDAREWNFLLPPGEHVRSVSAERQGRILDVSAELIPEEKQSRLKLRFSDPPIGPIRLRVLCERARPEKKPLSAGRFELENAETQSGVMLIIAGPDLWTRIKPSRGVQRIAPSQLEPSLQRLSAQRAFRYFIQPAGVEIDVENAQPVLAANVKTDVLVSVDRAEISARMRYSIERAHADRLLVRIPAEMTEVKVSPAEMITLDAIKPPDNDGFREAVLALAEPMRGEVDLTIKGHAPLKSQGVEILRLPIPVGSVDWSGTIAVRESPNVKLTLQNDRSRALRRLPLPVSDDSEAEAAWFFRAQQSPPEIAFSMERLPRRIEATIESDFRRLETSVDVKTTIRYRSRHEPMDQIVLAIPSGLESVAIKGDAITAGGPVGAGVATFPLLNPSETSEVIVEYRWPFDAGSAEGNVPLVLPRGAHVLGIKGDVWCAPGLQATVQPPWEGSVISGSGLGAGSERANLAVRTRTPTDTLPLRLESNVELALVIGSRQAIEEIHAEGRRWGRMRLLFAKHRARAIDLLIPMSCRLLDVKLDGEAATVLSQNGRSWRLRLPMGDRPCALEVTYEMPLPSMGAWRSWHADTPTVDGLPPMLETRWLIHTARDQLCLSMDQTATNDGRWRFVGAWRPPVAEATGDGLLAWIQQAAPDSTWGTRDGFDVKSPGRSWLFEGLADDRAPRFVTIREAFWVLLCSGTALLFVAAASATWGTHRFFFVGLAGVLLLWGLSVMGWLPWFGLGAQWGIALAAAWFAIQRWTQRFRVIGWTTRSRGRSTVSPSSLIRRLPAPAVSSATVSHEGSPYEANG